MRRVKNNTGWEEITTKCITVEHIWRNFQTNEGWVSAYTNGSISPKSRTVCKCCGSNWTENGSDVALAFTDKGNMILCQSCTDEFEKQGIKVVISNKNK